MKNLRQTYSVAIETIVKIRDEHIDDFEWGEMSWVSPWFGAYPMHLSLS